MELSYKINIFKRKVNLKEVAVYTASSFIICIAFAFMLFFKSYDAFDTYLSFIIPLMSFSFGMYTYCSYRNSSLSLVFATSTLNTIGFSLMCLISPEGLIAKHLIAIAGSILIFTAIRISFTKLNSATLSILCLLFTIALYMILTIQPAQNGAKAWLVIGGISLQLTELIKILFILSMGLLYSSNLKDSVKLFFLIGHLSIHTIFSVFFISELGSLMILFITGYIIQFLFGGKKETIILSIAAISILLIVIFKDNTANEALHLAINRVIDRFKNSDPFQINQAQKAFISGGIFGSSKNSIYIPVATSDFAYSSLAQHFGLIVSCIFLTFYISLIYILSKEVISTKFNTNCIISIITVITITTQSAYIIGANLGILPISGITTYYLSDSGTGIVLSYLFTMMIINGLSKERRAIDERTKRINKT